MKNILLLFLISLIIGLSIMKGSTYEVTPVSELVSEKNNPIPHIGRIQILNGCGIRGAAHEISDFLRSHHFDVKNIGNADNWNFPETLIISRTKETEVAQQVAITLSTDNIIFIRNQETRYDVTIIIGNDYKKRLK